MENRFFNQLKIISFNKFKLRKMNENETNQKDAIQGKSSSEGSLAQSYISSDESIEREIAEERENQESGIPSSELNQGRWSDIEHLIFLACISEFGRDWKKIEFYVRTRSSAQARSHAQKVLKKLDRANILKEVTGLRKKLNFQPAEYKCESLAIFKENMTLEDIRRFAADRMKRNKKKLALQKQKEQEERMRRRREKLQNQQNNSQCSNNSEL